MATILITAAIALVLLVIAWAWIDGGRRPLRTIVEPVRPQVSRLGDPSQPHAASGIEALG